MKEPIFATSDLNKSTNYVMIIGTIESTPVYSHQYDGVKYYSTRINSVRKKKTTRTDTVHVFIPEKYIAGDVVLDAGIRVIINGYLVQSKLRGISDISVVTTDLDFVQSEDTEDDNIVYLGGILDKVFEITHIKNSTKVVKHLILKNEEIVINEDGKEKKKKLSAKVSSWNNTAKMIDSSFKEKDDIIIRGLIESRLIPSNNESEKDPILIHQIIANMAFHPSENKEESEIEIIDQ